MSNSYYIGQFDATTIIVTITSALTLYNALELILLIFTTFAVYRGLYFWSLFVATTGLIPYVVGLILLYFQLTASVAGLVINNYGWWTAITGQSVVLYSRLGIVLGKGNDRILKYVKWMIIIDAICFHTTTTVVVFGSYYASPPAQAPFSSAYTYVEKIQMTGFCIQEFIISGLYLWKTMDIVQAQAHPAASSISTSEQKKKKRVHRVMWQLFTINIVIICLDIALLVIEYRNLHIPEVAFKGFCYSVKLKLEFGVLSKLVEVAGIKNPRTVSLTNTLDLTSHDMAESLPTVTDNADFVLDRGHHHPRSANSNLERLSGTEESESQRSEWADMLKQSPTRHIDDVEKDAEKDRKQNSSAFDAIERAPSSISTLVPGSVSGYPHRRHAREDSELLYADAIREMARKGRRDG
ncbi:uncharacterized protein Z520_05830 [Fonsecaea multimorphosa CBS 102226]|uniref:DUF7703 domain-containing protein n=1 Tax=Fonsecaea multimorphosa CBS 102226 TaxID=1442371 RepID=A0A0D2K5T9_9EURO|nr:uncharacterized protein Z520_05830 [Fonsecaea multimorphosa CBS 102226]KIX98529.1 hypothetical protein Z520_05830 [Fonsecaea multimorphosa CBS 102226]OAL24723.1 hypothetical protein AYO22_05512 [Fonsecaea multimorphosa]